mmetsp:Transcript_116803/g.203195  ORF Transcript_116803/g.203195 Transcript_116803/m.203195 type:complete len:201 (+) Transcript_116803:1156-1758(+)
MMFIWRSISSSAALFCSISRISRLCLSNSVFMPTQTWSSSAFRAADRPASSSTASRWACRSSTFFCRSHSRCSMSTFSLAKSIGICFQSRSRCRATSRRNSFSSSMSSSWSWMCSCRIRRRSWASRPRRFCWMWTAWAYMRRAVCKRSTALLRRYMRWILQAMVDSCSMSKASTRLTDARDMTCAQESSSSRIKASRSTV